jgi:hypothetical protein
MAFNGSGGWNRLYSWVTDAAAGIKIRADRMDAEMNDMCNNGLANCVTRNGQSPATANLPMGGFKHTGCANGSASTDYATIGQLQDSSTQLVSSGFSTGNFTQAAAVSGTWYTAISAATLAAISGPSLWMVTVSSQNTASAIYAIDVPTTASPMSTAAQIQAGTYAAGQIDGSGNFQVKQTAGSPQTINAVWLRIGT